MSSSTKSPLRAEGRDSVLSLYHLLDPEVLANPYPLFRRLRSEDPVHWDPFLHAWVVTRYPDVLEVLLNFSADRTPTPEQLERDGAVVFEPDRASDGEADVVHGRSGAYAPARLVLESLHAGAGGGVAGTHSRHRQPSAGWHSGQGIDGRDCRSGRAAACHCYRGNAGRADRRSYEVEGVVRRFCGDAGQLSAQPGALPAGAESGGEPDRVFPECD